MPREKQFAVRAAALDTRLEQIAAARGARYVDFGIRLATAEGAIRPEHSNDGLHPMGPASAIWADAIRPFVDTEPHGRSA